MLGGLKFYYNKEVIMDLDKRNIQNRNVILERLGSDEEYYGDFGKQYLSYSDIGTLLNNPEKFKNDIKKSVPIVVGKYFHTLICEPDKVDQFKIIEASTRNTKVYKELSGGEICLLQEEADKIAVMRDRLMANDTVRDLITGNVEYEKPEFGQIHGEWWKGKADIVNHDEKFIIDLKTTNDISKFHYSARKLYYNSQAYIYQNLFGYEFIYIVIDKNSHKIGIYDCSPKFIEDGKEKVVDAIMAYRTYWKDTEFDFKQHFINETL